MNEATIPATLDEAILTEPLWLLAWVALLLIANMGAIPFAITKQGGAWQVRKECLAIVASFIVAAMIMNWMYAQFGYVRLLGLAHLIAWTPAYVYVMMRRAEIGTSSWFGKYIHFYLVIAGISLVIDAVDVVRYLVGDGELYLRWS